jgi:membrane associated rhomboid family serine protease
MPQARSELPFELLLACRATDKPLYAAEYAKEHGLDRAVLDRALDELRHKGLLRLTEWVQGRGQGYILTEAGLGLMTRPGNFRSGSPIPTAPTVNAPEEADQEPSRTPLIKPGPPVVSYALIGINIAVFVVGMFMAMRDDINVKDYLFNDRMGPLGDWGSLVPQLVLKDGEWWRIVTYAFLHLGAFHLLLNSYALFILGPLLEALWGSPRLLLLYLVAAITGGCVVIWTERPCVGASGAISGLLTSLGVWVLLNRDQLPPKLASSLTRMVMINLTILVIISMQDGVSWEGHLGGALGGALASFPLQLSRHGESRRDMILGTLGTLLVPVVFLVLALGRTWGLMPPL